MRRDRQLGQDSGVSEILGVTMLLAMVVAIMSAVVVFLQPFVLDLNDNRAWAAGGVTAEQMNDRILVVAGMPNGTGLVHQTGIPGGSIDVLFNIESWTIGADIHGIDRVEVFRNGSGIVVNSDNRTAETIEIWTDGEKAGYWNGDAWTTEWSMSEWEIIIDAPLSYVSTLRIEVLDRNGTIIHRWMEINIDGLRLSSPLADGTFVVDLSNGAIIEKLPNKNLAIEAFPRLSHRETIDGGQVVRFVLLDIDVDSVATDLNKDLDLTSRGSEMLFDVQNARNLVLQMDIGGESTVEPRYIDHWTSEHEVLIATGNLEGYTGFGPKGPLSGSDGLTFHSNPEHFRLEVLLQRVEVVP